MKTTGLKSTIAELKRIEANNNFARIYVDTKTGKIFACEYLNDRDGHYNSDDAIEVLTYDGQYRYGKRAKKPTMTEIKAAVENILSLREEIIEGIDFTENEYNKVASRLDCATFDTFVNNIVITTIGNDGSIKDAIFIANDTFAKLS